MFDIKIILDLMSQAEKVKNVDKKEFVINHLIKMITQEEYDKYEEIINNIIEFIIFLSFNKKLLKQINNKIRCC